MFDKDDTPKETARQRALRIWHNAHVLRVMDIEVGSAADEPQTANKANTIVRLPTLSKEVKKLIDAKTEINLRHYLASLRAQKRKLLKEKLRRLQEAENGND